MLSELALRDFRCFSTCQLDLHPETTLLVGRNAQGKTSLLEAACVLLRLQSPRTSNRTDLIRLGAGTMVVEGRLKDHRLRCAQSASRRRLAVDEAVCGKSADYLEQSARVVWMDHRDMNLFRGSAEHRRRYLDFVASQMFPEYLKALRDYERALRGRNHVLKRDASVAWKQADAFAHVMDDAAKVLVRRRLELTSLLQPHAVESHHHLSEESEEASLTYAPGCGGNLFEELLARRDEELRSRSTAIGPHRDDLLLGINGLDAASMASEGQQRSFALSLKLAQAGVLTAQSGTPPLLLLDDVFGELDAYRRRALLTLLPQNAQKVITTTTLEWAHKESLDGLTYTIEKAQLALT